MSEQKELIKKIKSIRDNKGLTQQNLIDLTGYSKSTISRILQEGSENNSFRMDTLKAIEKVLMDDHSIQIEKIRSLEEKHEQQVAMLKEEIEDLRSKLETNEDEIKSIMGQLNILIAELNSQINFKSEQIKIKDTRMDQKDARYDKLFDSFMRLTDQMFNKCDNCHMKIHIQE